MRLGLHVSTVYRLLRRFALGQTADAITGQARGWRQGRSRLPASLEDAIDAGIQDFFLTPEAPSVVALHREIAQRCRGEGLPVPAVSTVRRRLRKLSRKVVATRREGRGAAEAQTMRPGRLRDDRPNALWQIDHSPADVVIVDVETRTDHLEAMAGRLARFAKNVIVLRRAERAQAARGDGAPGGDPGARRAGDRGDRTVSR